MNTTAHDQQAFEEIPIEIQETILLHTRKLPKGPARSEFVRALTRRTGELVCNYRCTLSYGMIGMILGEFIDETLTFAVPELLLIPKSWHGKLLQPTFNLMDKVLGAVGGWMGWKADRQRMQQIASARKALRDFEPQLRRILREELENFSACLSSSGLQTATST